jgi:alpha/beta superfamily hydrolase
MKQILLLVASTFIINAIYAVEKHLVSYTLVKSYTKENVQELWKKKSIPKIIMPVKNGVDVYEIIYKAQWIDGSWRNASGIYFAPKTDKTAPYVMYGHGTQIEKNREITNKNAQQNICMMFATDGYAAMYPDYFGIGKGEGKHLYQHAISEANSFIYMLYAVDELNESINVKHNGQLFLTGYSQGGHASMAAHKYIEALEDFKFKVTASSPMSGAYDMTGEQEKYMFQEYPRPFYLPYLLISYQKAYEIFGDKDIYAAFKSPFDTILPKYFENNDSKSLDELNKIMPKIPKDIVLDSIVNVYVNDSNFVFKERLRENNLTQWKPEAPMQLCFCKGDREVNYKNSLVAHHEMKLLGAENVKLNNLSDKLDHNTCAAFAVLSTKYFFNRYKKKGKNPKMKDLPRFKKFLVGFVKRKEEKKYLSEGRDNAYL